VGASVGLDAVENRKSSTAGNRIADKTSFSLRYVSVLLVHVVFSGYA
jgi:hypothetical protein